MNEPSVFNGPEARMNCCSGRNSGSPTKHGQVTMPRDAIHPNGMVEHRDVHNM